MALALTRVIQLNFKRAESTELDVEHLRHLGCYRYLTPSSKKVMTLKVGNFLEIHGFCNQACTEFIDFP